MEKRTRGSEYFHRDEIVCPIDDLFACVDYSNIAEENVQMAEKALFHVYDGAEAFIEYFSDDFERMQNNPAIESIKESLSGLCTLETSTPDIQEAAFALGSNEHAMSTFNATQSISNLLDTKAVEIIKEIEGTRGKDGMLHGPSSTAKTLVTELSVVAEMAGEYADLRTPAIRKANELLHSLRLSDRTGNEAGKQDAQLMAERTAVSSLYSEPDKSVIREDTARVLNAIEKCAAIACPDKAPAHAGQNFGWTLEKRQAPGQGKPLPKREEQYEYDD